MNADGKLSVETIKSSRSREEREVTEAKCSGKMGDRRQLLILLPGANVDLPFLRARFVSLRASASSRVISYPRSSAFICGEHMPRIETMTDRRQRIVAALSQTEAMDFAALATCLAIGVPLTFIAPFLVAILIKTIAFQAEWNWPLGFVSTFVLISLLIVPWLMWYERRTKGSFYADAARDHGNPYEASSYGEYEMNQGRAGIAAWTEISLTGPRLLWEFIDRVQGRGKLDTAKIAAAAELIDELIEAGQGVEIRELVTPARSRAKLNDLIDFLKRHDWADTSTDGKRVWVRSDVMKKL